LWQGGIRGSPVCARPADVLKVFPIFVLLKGNDMDTFSQLISLAKDGMRIPLTKEKCVPFDDFLIFNARCRKQVITIHTNDLFWIDFDGSEPMLLENTPQLFQWTLLKNIKDGNYEI
jgi:hypothetical protein